jgi:phenylacetate-CoA ligase
MMDYERYRGAEFQKPEAIREVQQELLTAHLVYAAGKSPYYRRLFRGKGVDPASVTLENIARLPLTDKTAFAEQNDDFLAAPMPGVVDIVLSSGTTGRPVKVMYTEGDLRRLAYNEEISLAGCGITKDDVALLTCTMDRCFIAGLAYYSGLRSLGAAVIRNGLSSPASHLEIIQRLRPTVIVGVPSFLAKLGTYLGTAGIDPKKSGVKKLVCIGEPTRGRDLRLLKMGEHLEKLWGAEIYSTYASSETITSFCECTAQNGGHLHPELAVVEIVDDDGKALQPGEAGEVVVTPLAIEGMPLIRFRTGDVSFLMNEPCTCGRSSARLGPILGRKKQMIKFRGTTLYPGAIYSVLDGIPDVGDYYVTVTSDYDLSDIVKVFAAVRNGSCSAAMIQERLQAQLRVRPEVEIVSEQRVREQIAPEGSRKVNRFLDMR